MARLCYTRKMEKPKATVLKEWFTTQLANQSKVNAGNLFGVVLAGVVAFWLLGATYNMVNSLVRSEVTILYGNTESLFSSGALLAADLFYPQRHIPVARFTSNMDWNTSTIVLDGSTSKTFDGKPSKYVWRIDDGSADNNTEKITHTFQHPGYYLIRLSVIDSNEQVDSATCQVYIPPAQLEPVVIKKESGQGSQAQGQNQAQSSSTTEWVPVGVFYNYTKMPETSNAALKSRFVESGCGLSNRNFNAIGLDIDRQKATTIISSFVSIVINLVFLVLGFKLLKKAVKKLKSYLSSNP